MDRKVDQLLNRIASSVIFHDSYLDITDGIVVRRKYCSQEQHVERVT